MITLTTKELRAVLRAGPFTFPGGYPLYLLTGDSATLCFTCARKEYRQVSHAIRHNVSNGFLVVACGINWEDSEMHCDHCNHLYYNPKIA